ncbi:MAG: MFS transporter [Flavobacteriales bacterium]
MVRTNKIEQMIIATVGFFWCFLMWFSTAAFSPTIADEFGLSTAQMGLLASSALWLAPVGRIIAGWCADRFGAPKTFSVILIVAGLVSIHSSFVDDYVLLFIERVIVAASGISFVVGIQHVAQWFESKEIGTAEGLYAGTGNAGAGVGALVLPRMYGGDYSSAFLHLGVVALVIGVIYLMRGVSAKSQEKAELAKSSANWKDTIYVWTRYIALALMLAYAMSFGLEIAMNAWLPGYYSKGFKEAISSLGFSGIEEIQVAAGTFAAVQSFNASLFRPFAGYMSDLWQRKGWTPFPLIAKTLPYSPRLHWLAMALVLITCGMIALTIVGTLGLLHASVITLTIFGIFVSFGTGGVFAVVPLIFKQRPGIATGFIGGVSCTGGIIYPLIYGFGDNIHMGYLYVALALFIPFILFYLWAAKWEKNPSAHGIGSPEKWLGEERGKKEVGEEGTKAA